MAGTYVPIESVTLASSAASVTFSAIPQTFTDLVVRLSARSTRATFMAGVGMELNGDGSTANYSRTYLEGSDGTVFSGRVSTGSQGFFVIGYMPGADQTANSFDSSEIYLPNYTGSTKKSLSGFVVSENDNTTKYALDVNAMLYQNTTAISSVKLSDLNASFAAGSTFHLYGIKNS